MLLVKIIPLVTIFVHGAWAQVAQCAAGYEWNKNSLNQDPCTVGSMLDASCRGLAEYPYPPLNASQRYLPPDSNHAGDLMCDCNTVMYSLYMACAACQGGQIYPWTEWVPQCQSVYVTQYPIDIAQGTAVPDWAYYNVTSLPDELWNATVAISIGRDPEQKPTSTKKSSSMKSTSVKSSSVESSSVESSPAGSISVRSNSPSICRSICTVVV